MNDTRLHVAKWVISDYSDSVTFKVFIMTEVFESYPCRCLVTCFEEINPMITILCNCAEVLVYFHKIFSIKAILVSCYRQNPQFPQRT